MSALQRVAPNRRSAFSTSDNEIITQTDRGTPLGEVFRRYWVPIMLSSEIPTPDCPPVRVRMMGEDLVAFRDSEGRAGVLDEYCAHRRASLFFGRNEECGLRCVYHGWKYDVAGRLVDTPAEPERSNLKELVRPLGYPCQEIAGAVFIYMGPPGKQPELPAFEWLRLPPDNVVTTKFLIDCNYLQALEGDCDTSHPAFLHRGNNGEGLAAHRGPRFEGDTSFSSLDALLTRMESTWCGLRAADIRDVGTDQLNVRVSSFAMPFIAGVPIGKTIDGVLDGYLVVYQVPIDDGHTMRINFRFKRSEPITEDEFIRDRVQVGPDFRFFATRANGYLLDRDRQRTHNYSGMQGFASQDAAITESMGPITDRSLETLGANDTYVIALRRLLLDSARDHEKGVDPPGLVAPSPEAWDAAMTCTSVTVPRTQSWKEAESRLYGLPEPRFLD